MSEDEPNVASPKGTEPAIATEAGAGEATADRAAPPSPMSDSAASADLANPSSVTPDGGANVRAAERPEVNKLHEWGAAVAIMAFLTMVLFGFFFFFRGISL